VGSIREAAARRWNTHFPTDVEKPTRGLDSRDRPIKKITSKNLSRSKSPLVGSIHETYLAIPPPRLDRVKRPVRGLDSRDRSCIKRTSGGISSQKTYSRARFTRPRGAEQVGCCGLDSRDDTCWSRRIRIERPAHGFYSRDVVSTPSRK
jgi:hypothetical protein